MGSEQIVAGVEGVSLSFHPVTRKDGSEETDQGGVDRADTEAPYIESPTNDPKLRKTNCSDFLYSNYELAKQIVDDLYLPFK